MAHGFPAKIYKKFWAVFVLFGEIFIFFEGKQSGGNFEIFQAILFFLGRFYPFSTNLRGNPINFFRAVL
jgi:hypothetical protein